MIAERVRVLRLKHAELVEQADEADHQADEWQGAGRSARVIAAARSRADKLREFARDVAREISAASVPA